MASSEYPKTAVNKLGRLANRGTITLHLDHKLILDSKSTDFLQGDMNTTQFTPLSTLALSFTSHSMTQITLSR